MTSLSKNARVVGLLYLTLMPAALRLEYIPGKLIVSGNAAATANNITAHQTLFRLGILSDLLIATMGIFLALALYRLFKGVNQNLATTVTTLRATPPPQERRTEAPVLSCFPTESPRTLDIERAY